MRYALPFLIVGLITGAALAESPPSVELEGVPKRLQLPLPAGVNRTLDAKLSGGTAEVGWISPVGYPQVRVMLTPAEKGQFHINLGNRTLYRVLRAVDASAFRIHLRSKKGKRARSVQINFTQEGRRDGVWRGELVRPDGEVVAVKPHRWYTPERFKTFRTRGLSLPKGVTVQATVDDQAFPLTKHDEGVYVLKLNKRVRRAWRQAGWLRIKARRGERVIASGRRVGAKPRQLLASDQSSTFVAHQRGVTGVPGSHEFITVHLNDITDGHVKLEVQTREGNEPLAAAQSVRQGDTVDFDYAGHGYELKVERMVNLLVGDDYIEVRISRTEPQIR